MKKAMLLAASAATLVNACASSSGGGDSRYNSRELAFGQLTAAQLEIENNPLNRIDLVNLIDPENRRAALRSAGVCIANNIGAAGGDRPANPDASSFSFSPFAGASTVADLRTSYLFKRYEMILRQLLEERREIEPPTSANNYLGKYERLKPDEISRLKKEKLEIEKEIGVDETPENINPTIELNCALHAFYTYYLSYPQFEFVIRKLSYYIADPYQYLDTPSFRDLFDDSAESRDYLKELKKASETATQMSDFERARMQAYLSNGLYDSFYGQAAKSIAISMRRNAIQDQILVHSEYFCRYFKVRLHDSNVQVNLGLGILGTTLGGLATIFTDPTTVRALAGAAAITAGNRAQYNEVMFANLAIQTVIAGIDLARENILRELNGYRFYPTPDDPNAEGGINPGQFNVYRLRASIPWDQLYERRGNDLMYAGAKIEPDTAKTDNLSFRPPQLSFSELIAFDGDEESGDAPTEDSGDDESGPQSPPDQSESRSDNSGNDGKTSAEKYMSLTSVAVYSLEASIRDAIRFQTSCSLAAGLTEATKAMEEARAPSVDTLTDSLNDLTRMMKATEELSEALEKAARSSRGRKEDDD